MSEDTFFLQQQIHWLEDRVKAWETPWEKLEARLAELEAKVVQIVEGQRRSARHERDLSIHNILIGGPSSARVLPTSGWVTCWDAFPGSAGERKERDEFPEELW